MRGIADFSELPQFMDNSFNDDVRILVKLVREHLER